MQPDDTSNNVNKSKKPRQLSNLVMSESLVQNSIRNTTKLFATANARNNDGQKDPANFVLSKSFKLFNPFSTSVPLIDKPGS